LIGVLLGTRQTAQALTFNLTFDASTAAAPANFFTAFDTAIQFYETTFDDPIAMNLQVGWGEVAGQSLPSGFLGESSAIQPGFFTFTNVKSALVNDAKSSSDLLSVANLPASDPTNGGTFKLSRANSRALGFMAGNGAGLDGSVGFNSADPFTFDPNNRAVPGKVDFIGVAEHEISEVMGRFGLVSGNHTPLDLFRYSPNGTLDLTPENGAYFSINGGAAAINTFNGTGGGDLSDWAGATLDAYNATLPTGVEYPISPGDITTMDVIGYDLLLPGDLNHDGHVDAADIPVLLQALVDPAAFKTNHDLIDAAFTKLADLNGDGIVTNTDIQALLNLLLSGHGSADPVPEPNTFLLAILIALVVRPRRTTAKSARASFR
jgi:hypothetical protein